ncbi:MAG: hypothetical protein V3U67_06435 [Gemmatimonadota bacterium]
MAVIPAVPAPSEVSESLAATAAELGLEKNFRQLEEEGYTVIEDAAPQELFQRLRGTILDHQSRVRTKGSGPRLLIGKEYVFSVNMHGVVKTVDAFLPYLRAAEEAHIVDTASLGGIVSGPQFPEWLGG